MNYLCRSIPYTKRVEEVLRWMDLPADQRPAFMTLYFDQPDSIGHTYGPDSKEVY